jgi:energy-coupling factor transport system substrate-specific component
MNNSSPSYYFTTRDLVTIAVLSALGGVLSTFVGYLGLLLNTTVGTPFGAGQFLSGLHVFWIVLATGLIRKTGSATAAGLLKGFVEFFTGSTHGIVVVLVSLIQGLIIDIGFYVIGQRDSLPLWCIISGFAAASNVIIFQLFFFSGAPLIFLVLLSILAFSSGIIFGGYFGHATTYLVLESQVYRSAASTTKKSQGSVWRRLGPYRLSALIFLIAIVFGASLYAVFVWRPTLDPFSCEVVGQVAQPLRFSYFSYSDQEVTFEAQLTGSVTQLPPQNYTGIQLVTILGDVHPLDSATTLLVISSDGYSATFSLEEVQSDNEIILVMEDGLRLVAKNYPGWFWVQKVVSIVIT